MYPAFRNLSEKASCGMLIAGRSRDGSPFLRTIDDENGPNEYQLAYKDDTANLSIWSLTIPATVDSPEMRLVATDSQDLMEKSKHKRDVTLKLSVGPASNPQWEGVVTKGFHSLTNGKGEQ